MSREHWGAAEEEEQVYETPVDDKGFKDRVRITTDDQGNKVRITTRLKVAERKTKVPRRVLERRNIAKFGQAANCDPALNLSTRSPDIIPIEDPKSTYKEEEVDPLAQARLAKERQLEKELLEAADEVATARVRPALGQEVAPEAKEEMPTRTPGKYVPPQRSSQPTTVEESTTIRVSHLPMESTEDDVRALFRPFGDVSRVSMPKKVITLPDGSQIRESRGFAYVAFFNRRDAERAMARLQRYPFGNQILELEWAKPQSRDGMPPPSGFNAAYATGYGKKLAQDTTERVTYASNLTR